MKLNKIKHTIALILLLLSTSVIYACPVCERNQPKILKGVVHGVGPDQWDYVIMWTVIGITIAILYFSVKWLIKPGETEAHHIKYSILNDESV